MDKQTGGPAFPEHLAVTPMGDTYSGETGMTLRDYFAAKALAAMIGHEGKDGHNSGPNSVNTLPAFAYEYADAMLAERAK